MPDIPWLRRTFATLCLLAYGAQLYIFDPATSPWVLNCQFWELTGLQCPGCGTQRAVHAALHGDLAAALAFNWFDLVLLPYIALFVIEYFFLTERTRGPLARFVENRWTLLTVALLAAAWGVVRNLLGV